MCSLMDHRKQARGWLHIFINCSAVKGHEVIAEEGLEWKEEEEGGIFVLILLYKYGFSIRHNRQSVFTKPPNGDELKKKGIFFALPLFLILL